MVDGVNIVFEGDSKLRSGFRNLLDRHVERARNQRIRFRLISGGPRFEAVKDFLRICELQPSQLNILLIDSEVNVSNTEHAIRTLRASNFWDVSVACDDDQINFMVQAMEAWFIADPRALIEHFGHGFNANVLPNPQNVESVSPSEAITSIRSGLPRGRRRRRTYSKSSDGARLLELIDETIVGQRCRHFRRLMDFLDGAF